MTTTSIVFKCPECLQDVVLAVVPSAAMQAENMGPELQEPRDTPKTCPYCYAAFRTPFDNRDSN
jgi:hypothetical protein